MKWMKKLASENYKCQNEIGIVKQADMINEGLCRNTRSFYIFRHIGL